MQYIPRPYQVAAINAGVFFFKIAKKYHAIEILPTGSGKSIVIAGIVKEIEGNVLVLQPSVEILEQNYAKYISHGFRAGIYSHSAGQKRKHRVTFATIGSIIEKKHLFRDYPNILIDECHLVNPAEGMYHSFIKIIANAKVLGLTATPYRLTSGRQGAVLEFLTRTSPRLFTSVIYFVQNQLLFDEGHLAKLKYYNFDVIDRKKIDLNKSGTDFDDISLRKYYRTINMPLVIIDYAHRILPKRKNLLIFCSLIDEAYTVAAGIPGAKVIHGKTEKADRKRMLKDFVSGKIKCLVNVGVLTTGFDFPALECILLGRSTMSLALYYQMVGRAMRTHPEKENAWIVDLGGNVKFFGKVETLKIEVNDRGFHFVSNQGKQLTNVMLQKI